MGLFSQFGEIASKIQAQNDDTGVSDIFKQLNLGVEGLQPYADAGIPALAGLEQGSTLEGFGGGLSDIFNSPAIQPLIQDRMRAADSAFGSAGLTRSGGAIQAAADIPTELAMMIEELINGRQSQLAGLGVESSATSAGLRNQASLGRADVLADRFATQTGADQASKGRKQDRLMTGLRTFGSIAGAFSDKRLKTNIKPIGKIKDLTVYEWDWVEGVPEEVGKMNTGFMAQDVEEKYPEFVNEMNGFLTIDYQNLMNKLEVAHA